MIVPESTKIKQKKWHDQRILRKEFKAGDQVLLFRIMKIPLSCQNFDFNHFCLFLL